MGQSQRRAHRPPRRRFVQHRDPLPDLQRPGWPDRQAVPRINGTKYHELYIGAPARQILPSEPIAPSEARKKDGARKRCPECGASVFVTTTACASCGLKITEHVHGDDPDAVARKEEDLAARNAETGWTPPPLVTVRTAESTEKDTPDPSTGDLEQDRME
jgi:hypothetical protein